MGILGLRFNFPAPKRERNIKTKHTMDFLDAIRETMGMGFYGGCYDPNDCIDVDIRIHPKQNEDEWVEDPCFADDRAFAQG